MQTPVLVKRFPVHFLRNGAIYCLRALRHHSYLGKLAEKVWGKEKVGIKMRYWGLHLTFFFLFLVFTASYSSRIVLPVSMLDGWLLQ